MDQFITIAIKTLNSLGVKFNSTQLALYQSSFEKSFRESDNQMTTASYKKGTAQVLLGSFYTQMGGHATSFDLTKGVKIFKDWKIFVGTISDPLPKETYEKIFLKEFGFKMGNVLAVIKHLPTRELFNADHAVLSRLKEAGFNTAEIEALLK